VTSETGAGNSKSVMLQEINLKWTAKKGLAGVLTVNITFFFNKCNFLGLKVVVLNFNLTPVLSLESSVYV